MSDGSLSATFGGFMSELELKEFNDFVYPGHTSVVDGFPPNYPLTNTAVTGLVGNAAWVISLILPFPLELFSEMIS